ncbi:MAG: fructose-6-phosphate aldolase [archaeon]
MKFFIDTANIEEIKEAGSWGVLDGVTTNPSLMAKESGKSFEEMVKEICSIVNGPISVEETKEKAGDIVKEAVELSKIHKNIVVKVPITEEGLKAMKELRKKGVKTNCTLVFSANQALMAAKAGANYVSVFVGRLDDIGENGMDVVRETVECFRKQNIKAEIIVASVRNTEHVTEAAKSGAEIATIPFGVMKEMVRHSLTDAGIKKFMEDWKKVKK